MYILLVISQGKQWDITVEQYTWISMYSGLAPKKTCLLYLQRKIKSWVSSLNASTGGENCWTLVAAHQLPTYCTFSAPQVAVTACGQIPTEAYTAWSVHPNNICIILIPQFIYRVRERDQNRYRERKKEGQRDRETGRRREAAWKRQKERQRDSDAIHTESM